VPLEAMSVALRLTGQVVRSAAGTLGVQAVLPYIDPTPRSIRGCMSELLERLQSALADRYAVESEIGRGGMAVVFLAEDLRHHRQVALKVLHPELAASLGAERFLHEIETIASLNHPHILPLHDSGEADGLLYYVMPYAEGESLRQRLDREAVGGG